MAIHRTWKSKLRIWLRDGAQVLPTNLINSAYNFVFLVFERYLRFSFSELNFQIWTRNSVRSKRIEPFISDIDTSLVFCDLVSVDEILRLHRSVRAIQRVLPLLHEINVYPYSWRSLTLKNMNPNELARDPVLKSSCSESSPVRVRTGATDALFLSKALEADCANLHFIAETREKKWAGHFSDLGFQKPSCRIELSDIVHQIVVSLNLPKEESASAEKQIRKFYEVKFSDRLIYTLDCELRDSPWIWSIFFNHYCYVSAEGMAFSPSQISMIEEHIRWDIFGTLTQYFNMPDRDFFLKHLNYIRLRAKELHLDTLLISDIESALALLNMTERQRI